MVVVTVTAVALRPPSRAGCSAARLQFDVNQMAVAALLCSQRVIYQRPNSAQKAADRLRCTGPPGAK